MSRNIMRVTDEITIISGGDNALGRFLDITDSRYANSGKDEQGEGYVFEWSENLGITTNLLKINRKVFIDHYKNTPETFFEFVIEACDTVAMWYGAEVIDVGNLMGDTVLCDVCNADYTNSEESGGFLFSSYAYCPKCAKDKIANIRKLDEEKYISAHCPDDMSFRDWIINVIRKG